MSVSFNSTEAGITKSRLKIHPIRLKSINEQRALSRSNKQGRYSSAFLTDQLFENYQAHPSSSESSTRNNCPNMPSLQLQIALATSKALTSIKSYNASKEFSVSSIRNSMMVRQNAVSSGNSPMAVERIGFEKRENAFRLDGCDFTSNYSAGLRVNSDLAFKESNKVPEDREKTRKEVEMEEENNEIRMKENIFINKIKQATIKLKKLRECMK